MASSKGQYLISGDFLNVGDWLQSGNGPFRLRMQEDSNICVVRGEPGHDELPPLWSTTNSAQPFGEYFLAVQADGNLCISSGDSASPGTKVWCRTNSSEPLDNYFAWLEDNGNFS